MPYKWISKFFGGHVQLPVMTSQINTRLLISTKNHKCKVTKNPSYCQHCYTKTCERRNKPSPL